MHISVHFEDQNLVPYLSAIAQLRTIRFALTPTDKLLAVLSSAKAVYWTASTLSPERSVGGVEFWLMV